MAKQVIDIGTTANDGTGDPIRDAFDKVNDNFTELYTDDAGDVDSIIAGTGIAVDAATGNVTVTNSAPDQTVALTGGTQISTSGTYPNFTITNDAPNATHTGDVTGSGQLTIVDDKVITSKILNLNVTTAKIADNNVTHDKLENRYTEAVTVSTLTGTYSLDWSAGAVFVMSGSLSGAINFQFGNMKIGQVIDIYNLTGSQTVTFSTASGTPVFNKCGAVDYAGGSTNLIQVQCVSDASNAVFNYAVSAYVSDSTPS